MKQNNHTIKPYPNRVSYADFLASATGKVSYRLTNDYLFHAVLQKSNKVLKALLCSLLHLKPEDITSVAVTNPIELGKSIDSKNFFLDIRILMNDSTLINLEMQVANEGNWPDRSLSYLCRAFDNLNAGEHYDDLKPAIHIGILDFTLFPEHPEFHSAYFLMNAKNYTIYSDKLMLTVVNLPQIHLATETDRAYQLDCWAALFQASTWEDIKMIASRNDTLQEAAETMYRLSQNEKIRLQCEARERYYRDQKTHQYQLEKIKKLGEIEEKLKAAEGKLEITGEKLEAAEGKLEITGEKLEAAEEKLEITEEKLEAAEGKLVAAEGKLIAAESKLMEAEDRLMTAEGKLEITEGRLEAAKTELQQRDLIIREKDSLLHETISEIEKLRSEIASLRTSHTT